MSPTRDPAVPPVQPVQPMPVHPTFAMPLYGYTPGTEPVPALQTALARHRSAVYQVRGELVRAEVEWAKHVLEAGIGNILSSPPPSHRTTATLQAVSEVRAEVAATLAGHKILKTRFRHHLDVRLIQRPWESPQLQQLQ